jgi:5'-3' exonuclease
MNIININKDNNVILIDASYYIFHRYFATYRWFSFQKIEVSVDDIVDNEIFITAFYKHIQNDIKKMCKLWKTNSSNIILCNDCLRCDIWRNDIYDKYKATRTQKNNFNKKIFSIFNEHIKKFGIKSISSERLEGDDVIYLSQKFIKKNINSKVIIITNDNDFLQLIDTNVLIYNMQFKEVKKRGFDDPKIDLLYKAIYGDRSDNIPKIGSCITKDKALALAKMTDKQRNAFMKENDLTDKFEFNISLVSFEKIPEEYIQLFNKNINIIIN